MTAPSETPMQTLSENGQPPKQRVRDAADASAIVQSLIEAGSDRAWFNAKVKGGFDGNPPYNKALLRQQAQAHRANVNFMEMDAVAAAAAVPYYDLFAGSQFYCDVKLHLENPDDQEATSGIATEEFDSMLKKYQAFEFNMTGVINDFIRYGKGFTMFPNKWGWHFQRVSHTSVFVPNRTAASVEKLERVAILDEMELHTLWNYIKDKPGAREVGWKPDAVAEAIRLAMPTDEASLGTLSYDYVQSQMRDRDMVHGSGKAAVKVAHLLTKEFDGTITHQIIEHAPRQTSTDNSKTPVAQFLFVKRGCFDNMRECLQAFFFETEDGSWNGARGLGHKIYATMEIKNRGMCLSIDSGFGMSGVTLQANDASALQKLNVVRIGIHTILPPGFTVQNSQIYSNNNGLLGINQLLDSVIASNTGIFRAKMEKPQGNPRTAKEVEIQFQNATVLSNSGVSRFYRQIDPLYAELYRRVVNESPLDSDKGEEAEAVREFRRRCAKRGVTLSDLKKVESVKACRNIGNGSQRQRTQELEEFAPYVSMLPESGKQKWMELVVGSKFGQSIVERLVPPRDKQLMPNDQQAMALIENAALKQGAPVAWTPTQNNVIHATEHLKAMSGAAESLDAGAQPMEVLAFLEAAGAHTQEHMMRLETDPSRKTEFALLQKHFQQVAKFTDELQQHVQDGQEAEQQAQQEQMAAQQKAAAIASGQDPETMIATEKAKHDAKLKEAKTLHNMSLTDAKNKQKMAIADIKLAQSLKHEAVKSKQPQPA